MRLPGYSAEAALALATDHWTGEVGRTGASRSIVPQQEFPPDRELPPITGCDHSSVYEEPCSPCQFRRLPLVPPMIGPRFVWRESVRRCITFYDHNGQAYPFCRPCFERSCSHFVVLGRFSAIRLS